MPPFVHRMSSVKDKVRHYLEKHTHLRDDDNKLIATVWFYEVGGDDKLKQMTGKDFLTMFAEGKLSSPESIRRVRAKLQEDYPELRGESYFKRKKDGDDFSKYING